MKHTKGPWIFHKYQNEPFATHAVYGQNTEDSYYGPKGPQVVSLSGNDDSVANGYLIAAAPEMLEALERLVELFRPELQEKFNFTINEKALAVGAIQAIKKAKGEI